MPPSRSVISFATLVVLATACHSGEKSKAILDESKVPAYTLPDTLVCLDGTKVQDAQTWTAKRRPELLELYHSQMHGRSPARPAELKFEVTSTDANALNGLATRKEISILVSGESAGIGRNEPEDA